MAGAGVVAGVSSWVTASGAGTGRVGSGVGVGAGVLSIRPSVRAPDCGAVTGWLVCGCDGMNTGGSRSPGYSLSGGRVPQFASTSNVTNGSVTERLDVTLMVTCPSRLRLTAKSNPDR